MTSVAIDPGESGGVAWCDAAGNVDAVKMPDGMTAQMDLLLELKARLDSLSGQLPAWIELVNPMPSDGRASVGVFMRHAGALDSGLYLCGYSARVVSPVKWQSAIGVPRLPPLAKDMDQDARRTELARRKADRKRWIRDAMQRRYPHLRVTLNTADALGILTFALAAKDSPGPTPFDA